MTASDLGLLGLGVRGGNVVIGTAGVRAGLKRGDVWLVVVAQNVSDRTRDKVVHLAKGKGVEVRFGPAADQLGHAVGRRTVQAVGVKDVRLAQVLAERMQEEV